jgi:hypothetical protein
MENAMVNLSPPIKQGFNILERRAVSSKKDCCGEK